MELLAFSKHNIFNNNDLVKTPSQLSSLMQDGDPPLVPVSSLGLRPPAPGQRLQLPRLGLETPGLGRILGQRRLAERLQVPQLVEVAEGEQVGVTPLLGRLGVGRAFCGRGRRERKRGDERGGRGGEFAAFGRPALGEDRQVALFLQLVGSRSARHREALGEVGPRCQGVETRARCRPDHTWTLHWRP